MTDSASHVSLAGMLGGHEGTTLPAPLANDEIPAEAARAYVVLTSAALRRTIAELEANPPTLALEDPERFEAELDVLRGLEMVAIEDWARPVMAQLIPLIQQLPASGPAPA